MNSGVRFSLTLTLVAVALFAPSTSLHAAESKLEAATVNVYCRIKLGGNTFSSTGSGSFISDKGVILTNAHVAQYFLLATSTGKARSECSIRNGSPAKEVYKAEVLYLPPGWVKTMTDAVDGKTEGKGSGEQDFALLRVTQAKKGTLPTAFPFIPVADTATVLLLKDGDALSVAGYPADKLDYKGVNEKLARLVASSTLTGTRSFLPPSPDILSVGPSKAGKSGVSGGPVVNVGGSVVGIATTMGSEKANGLNSLRAISTVYMDRVVRTHTSAPFSTLLTGDLAAKAKVTYTTLATDMRKALETALRRVK